MLNQSQQVNNDLITKFAIIVMARINWSFISQLATLSRSNRFIKFSRNKIYFYSFLKYLVFIRFLRGWAEKSRALRTDGVII